mgnify:CR=1 FL=1
MAEHNEFGKEGETAAADFLTEKATPSFIVIGDVARKN